MISTSVVADSVSLANVRITTFELTLPKWLLAELNTYRIEIARNSASSRAVPTLAYVEQVDRDPFVFSEWKYRSPEGGMVPGGPMSPADAALNLEDWLLARDAVLFYARRMEARKSAKEQVNRMLEPWMWTKTVLTSTGLENLFFQRLAADAQGEFQQLARAMSVAQRKSKPVLRYGKNYDDQKGWHLPYITEEEREVFEPRILTRRSATRCARVSYLRQGLVKDVVDEVMRCDSLIKDHHWSPLEMPCFALDTAEFCGPFRGWRQFRKFWGGESGSPDHGTRADDPWVHAA